MEILFYAAILGCIPASIAKNKGYSFVGWWLYGSLLFIIALPHALLKKPDQDGIDRKKLEEGMKKCPHCAEIIRGEAQVCRYCNGDVSSIDSVSIYKICPYCHARNRKSDNNCMRCGKEMFGG